MIVQLTGTLVEALPTHAVLDVGGVGFELGISSQTASRLAPVGSQNVTLLTRMVVREDAMELYGFGSREERALFDKLVGITGVGPKLALSVLSTYTPSALATIVATGDLTRLAQVPGIGKRKGQRLMVELEGVLQSDASFRALVGQDESLPLGGGDAPAASGVLEEAQAALLSMGFTPQEADLALEGAEKAGATTIEATLSYALRRLGGGR